MKRSTIKWAMVAGLLMGLPGAWAQDRGHSSEWEFFNPYEIQRKVFEPELSSETKPVRDIRQTPLPNFVSEPVRGENEGFRQEGMSPFDRLLGQCVIIEWQFGRDCNAEQVKELLATSAVFEGDAAPFVDILSDDANVVTAANEVLKDATSEELKVYAWTLLYENAVYFDGEMHQLLKDAKMLRIDKFGKMLKNHLIQIGFYTKKGIDGLAPAGSDEAAKDEDAFRKKYDVNMEGRKMPLSGHEPMPGMYSCLKHLAWKVPKAGGGFGPMGAAGDVPPDMGGGGPTSPDDKPQNVDEKLKGLNPDCTALDPNKFKGDQVGYNPEKASGKGMYEPWKEKIGGQFFGGSGTGQMGSGLGANKYKIDGSTKEKAVFQKAAAPGEGKKIEYIGSEYEHQITTSGQNGQGTETQTVVTQSPSPPQQVTTKKGDVVKLQTKPEEGTQTGSMKPEEQKKSEEQKKKELEKPQPKDKKKGYDDPNGDVVAMAQSCQDTASNSFKNCLNNALLKDFEKGKDEESDYCKQKGWVAGDSDGGSKITGTGVDCTKKKGSAEGLNQPQMFMKSGGGWSDDPWQKDKYKDSKKQSDPDPSDNAQ